MTNLQAFQQRVEERKRREFDFVVTRAVARLEKLVPWSLRIIREEQQHALPNGLLALKGSNVPEEIKALPRKTYTEIYPIKDFFSEEFFDEKVVAYVQY